MSREEAVRFLKDYKEDEALMEKTEALFSEHPGLKEEELWKLAADTFGYAFEPFELAEQFNEKVHNAKKAKEVISDDSELLAATGGSASYNCMYAPKDHHPDKCRSTYLDKENCWHNDGCDMVYFMYDDYACNNSGECDYIFTHR